MMRGNQYCFLVSFKTDHRHLSYIESLIYLIKNDVIGVQQQQNGGKMGSIIWWLSKSMHIIKNHHWHSHVLETWTHEQGLRQCH